MDEYRTNSNILQQKNFTYFEFRFIILIMKFTERVSKVTEEDRKKGIHSINQRLPELLDSKYKYNIAMVISLMIFVLGLILVIPPILRKDTFSVIVTVIQSVITLSCILVTFCTKKTGYFTVISHILIYYLAAFYLIRGGTEGFGVYWLMLELVFTVCYYNTLDFLITDTVLMLMVLITFYSPIAKYCFPFSDVIRGRYPLLFASEFLFLMIFRIKASGNVAEKNEVMKELQELQNSLEHQVELKTKELRNRQEFSEKMMLETITALAGTIDAKDKYTNGHSQRVAQYSREIAIRMHKNKEYQQKIYIMGLLHDIGKIGIPDTIINKTDKLTKEEYEIIKTHCEIGSNILREITTIPQIGYGARWHHERYDGKGFPDKLSGDDIPEMARIICVADSYDAMTSNRSYRVSLDQQTVRSEIEKGKGTQFDPQIAEIMLQMIDEDKDFKMHM